MTDASRCSRRDGAARAGVLRTAHGEIPTPAFMPVGTKATVKTLHPDEVRALGAHVILGNTYHLHFRPGEDVVEELGGLHAFSRLGRPDPHRLGRLPGLLAARHAARASTTTASPSARSTTARRRASRPRASPRSSAGSAPTSRCASTSARLRTFRERELEQAVRRTTLWAERQAARAARERAAALRDRAGRRPPRASPPLDRRGRPPSPSTATRSAGSPWARTGTRCWRRSAGRRRSCPRASPRYFMGIGDAEGILEVSRGGSTCSTASCRRAPPAPARRSRERAG